MKRLLIYNLGRRGFFSEINNMLLAKIYAEKHNLNFAVNSYYWNCRYKKGIHDYFDNEINELNNPFSAQITRNKPNFKIGFDLYTVFHNINYIKNSIYLLFNNDAMLGADIYDEIRSEEFRSHIDPTIFLKELKDVLCIKSTIQKDFESTFYQLEISSPFIGIHIRRGDKITTGEMNDISLDKYIDEVLRNSPKAIYIATDDIQSVNYIKSKMKSTGIDVFYNPSLSGKGFSEGSFNHSSRKSRYVDTLTLLFDIFILSKASYFIGTYSSNLSRVIPCLLGFDNCTSLDEKWYIG